VKDCAEEEDEAVAQGTSSFMLRGESSMDVDAQLLSVASSSNMGEGCFDVVVASGRSVTTTSWMLVAGLGFHVSLAFA
jgi:hypothetical protein